MKNLLILVVEDDKVTADLISTILEGYQFRVEIASNAFQARGMVQRHCPDLIVLDRGLPDKDGIEFCEQLRQDETTREVPVLFLTGSKTSIPEKVAGLRVGGDDYLTKPFSKEELVARIHSILRRNKRELEPQKVFEAGGLRLDLESRQVFLKKKQISLTHKEFDLLQAFLERENKALSRRFLMTHVWGYEKEIQISLKTVDVTIGHLRSKLGPAGKMLVSVTGYGYRFEVKKS